MCTQSNEHLVMKYNGLLREICRQSSKFDISSDLMYTSHEGGVSIMKYLRCVFFVVIRLYFDVRKTPGYSVSTRIGMRFAAQTVACSISLSIGASRHVNVVRLASVPFPSIETAAGSSGIILSSIEIIPRMQLPIHLARSKTFNARCWTIPN